MDNHHFGYSVVFIMDNQKLSIIGATDLAFAVRSAIHKFIVGISIFYVA
jgi:hypothetical protein